MPRSKVNLNTIDWDFIQQKHNEGMYLSHITKNYNISRNTMERAIKEGYLIKHKWSFKHTEQTKQQLSNIRKKYYHDNPDKHPWKKHNRFISEPCELFKKRLLENNINFIAEYQPLLERFYSIDIAFPDKKIGLEINGNQHYNSDGALKPYYIEKHLLIEQDGWKIFEIHYSLIYRTGFIESIIEELKTEYHLEQIDYSDFIIRKKHRINKYGTKKDYNQFIKERSDRMNMKRVEIILKSTIDFTKLGWVKEVANLLQIKSQKVNKLMKKYALTFYNEKCYKRQQRTIKVLTYNNNISYHKPKVGNRIEYIEEIQREAKIRNQNKINKLINSNIDFTKFGWVQKASELIGMKPQKINKWMKKYLLEFYQNNCFHKHLL
jgi:very-short-patch-repair endonuclease